MQNLEIDKDKDNNRRWYNEKHQYHRSDGPALELSNGSKKWWLNGNLHRDDGPAIEWKNGDKAWYLNGKLHRTNGPAIEYSNGYKSWYLNGIKYSKEDYDIKLRNR